MTEKPRHVPGRVVYVGFRVYDPKTQRMRSCRGLNIRLEKFTPQEAHDLIVRAVLDGVSTARIVDKSKGAKDHATNRSNDGEAGAG